MNSLKRQRSTTKIIFVLYCMILIWLVLFKMAFSVAEIKWLKMPRSVNGIPFYYDADVGAVHDREVILNVLVFVPFGLYLRMLNVSWKKAVLSGCLCSIVFELCQFAFSIGASDITDLITNTLGTAAGVCLYALARKVFANKQKTDSVINILAMTVLVVFFLLTGLLFLAN